MRSKTIFIEIKIVTAFVDGGDILFIVIFFKTSIIAIFCFIKHFDVLFLLLTLAHIIKALKYVHLQPI